MGMKVYRSSWGGLVDLANLFRYLIPLSLFMVSVVVAASGIKAQQLFFVA
jgi:hypothetical protein